ncbi:hypothetical protein ILUMI_23918 [Ignelater luminosus]|uniref:YqaJ viral recombinase domain-containing protein n=1 Tax=Ignelater luminosus TaxID=2038154 RepID=A0A8K0CEH0_IGNLU|nr:hypothetical protein ILUMI_23918 [Ignelater luminosus]
MYRSCVPVCYYGVIKRSSESDVPQIFPLIPLINVCLRVEDELGRAGLSDISKDIFNFLTKTFRVAGGSPAKNDILQGIFGHRKGHPSDNPRTSRCHSWGYPGDAHLGHPKDVYLGLPEDVHQAIQRMSIWNIPENVHFGHPYEVGNFSGLNKTRSPPCMSEEEHSRKSEAFLLRLQQTNRKMLKESTRAQSNSTLWTHERLKRLTASEFGRLIRLRQTTSRENVVKSLLYSDFKGNKATRYGNAKEVEVKRLFESIHNVKIVDCGMFVHKTLPYLSASPDGLIGEDSLIEIKCPFSAKDMTIKESVAAGKIKFLAVRNEQMFLKENHKYFYQV